MKLLIADALLNSCCAVLLGPFCKKVRDYARKNMEDWMQENEISISSPSSLSHYYTNPKEIFVTHDMVPDIFNLDNAVMARLSKEIPVICEGSQTMEKWIRVLERQNNPISISTMDSSWKETVASAMKTEATLILSIYFQKPDLFLLNFLKRSQWCRFNYGKLKVEHNGEFIEVHKNFRLYLILNRPMHLVDKAWFEYSTPISSYLDPGQVGDILLDISLIDYASTLRGIIADILTKQTYENFTTLIILTESRENRNWKIDAWNL